MSHDRRTRTRIRPKPSRVPGTRRRSGSNRGRSRVAGDKCTAASGKTVAMTNRGHYSGGPTGCVRGAAKAALFQRGKAPSATAQRRRAALREQDRQLLQDPSTRRQRRGRPRGVRGAGPRHGTADPEDFEAFPSAAPASWSTRRPDSRSASAARTRRRAPLRVPPKFASAETAGEMVELYWAALARDVPFDSSPPIRRSRPLRGTVGDERLPRPEDRRRGDAGHDLPGPDGRRSDRALHLAAAVEADQLRAVRGRPARPRHARPRDPNADYLWTTRSG